MEMDSQTDSLIDCSVCLYWSERLDAIRTSSQFPSEAIGEEKRLLAILREHQVEGACLRRLPYLTELATEMEENPDQFGEWKRTPSCQVQPQQRSSEG